MSLSGIAFCFILLSLACLVTPSVELESGVCAMDRAERPVLLLGFSGMDTVAWWSSCGCPVEQGVAAWDQPVRLFSSGEKLADLGGSGQWLGSVQRMGRRAREIVYFVLFRLFWEQYGLYKMENCQGNDWDGNGQDWQRKGKGRKEFRVQRSPPPAWESVFQSHCWWCWW